MDVDRLIAGRADRVSISGIRKVFELGKSLKNPIDLSIGQPDFAVADAVKAAAVEAINGNRNGYTVTVGDAALRARIASHLKIDVTWDVQDPEGPGLLVTSGTSGGLLLAALSVLDPGDEMVIPDPGFVGYPHMAEIAGGVAVRCDTGDDGRMTAQRVEPLLGPKTKMVLMTSPSNPTGVVLTEGECRELHDLCRSRGVLLLSDEIYDRFTFADGRTQPLPGDPGKLCCPSPARFEGAAESLLLLRGFGKTYGCTGWRLGYAAGPRPLINAMMKLQQFSYVCAPTPLQHAAIAMLDTDMSERIAAYERRRDLVVERLSPITELPRPQGAFYAFPKLPERLGMTGTQFAEACIERNLLVIPGGVFSSRDTHIRISFSAPDERLAEGLDIICEMMGGG